MIAHQVSVKSQMEIFSMFEDYLMSLKDHTKDGKDGKEGKDDGCHLDDYEYTDRLL